MADKRISQLTAATSVTGPELYVGLQGGVTKAVSGSLINAYVSASLVPKIMSSLTGSCVYNDAGVSGSTITNALDMLCGRHWVTQFVSTDTAISNYQSNILYKIHPTSSHVVLTLPSASLAGNIIVKAAGLTGSYSASILPVSGETIDGGSEFVFTVDGEAVTLIPDSNNANYEII